MSKCLKCGDTGNLVCACFTPKPQTEEEMAEAYTFNNAPSRCDVDAFHSIRSTFTAGRRSRDEEVNKLKEKLGKSVKIMKLILDGVHRDDYLEDLNVTIKELSDD